MLFIQDLQPNNIGIAYIDLIIHIMRFGPYKLWEFYPEPAPGHLHQGGILISWGGKKGGGGGGSGGKRAICDRVQLLTLVKACNRFLMCAVLEVSLSLSKLITFSKEGRG